MKTILKISFAVLFAVNGFAQNDETIFKQVITNDSAAVNALALYPVAVRNTIFEVSAHPEVLVRMDALQQETKEQFKNLLALYSKEDQQKIWDITRYPGLVNQLADQEIRAKVELPEILETFPVEIRETALEYGKSHGDVFVKINILNKNSDLAFEELIKKYSKNTQYAFRELVKYPELISILNSNMRMTVLVGDIYKRNPNLLKRKLDSINTVLAEQNAKDLKDWQDGLEKNPEAKKEFEESAKEYAQSQGYKDEDLVVHDTRVIVEYVPYPYPYWYGYPWWWDHPYWYPYPYWYDWGFYYGPSGMVYIGFPSWYFMHWHFYHYPHHYYYPYFSDYCINHYYGHRHSFNDANKAVREWVNERQPHLPQNFLANDSKRAEKLKELGKFEMDYDSYLTNNPGKAVSKNEFLETNKNQYKNLSPLLKPENRNEVQQQKDIKYDYWEQQPQREKYPDPNMKIERDFPEQKPAIKFQKQMPEFRQQEPKNRMPQNTPKIRKTTGGKKMSSNPAVREDFNKMNQAQNYHRDGWNKNNSSIKH